MKSGGAVARRRRAWGGEGAEVVRRLFEVVFYKRGAARDACEQGKAGWMRVKLRGVEGRVRHLEPRGPLATYRVGSFLSPVAHTAGLLSPQPRRLSI